MHKYICALFLSSDNLYNLLCTFTEIQCDNLLLPANGEIVSCISGRVGVGYEGDTCNFTCNTGYELTGGDTRTCQSNGSWSGSDDVCRQGSCHALYYTYATLTWLQMIIMYTLTAM